MKFYLLLILITLSAACFSSSKSNYKRDTDSVLNCIKYDAEVAKHLNKVFSSIIVTLKNQKSISPSKELEIREVFNKHINKDSLKPYYLEAINMLEEKKYKNMLSSECNKKDISLLVQSALELLDKKARNDKARNKFDEHPFFKFFEEMRNYKH